MQEFDYENIPEKINVRIVIPTFNEGKNVCSLISKLRQMGFNDLLVIDGHSQDDTVETVQNMGVKVIFQNGYGKGDALRQAFWECLNSDATVIMDADGSMIPEELPLYIKNIIAGADIVKGSRFLLNGKSEDFTLFRKLGNRILTGLTNFLFLTDYTDLCYGYIAFNRDALAKLSPCLTSKNFEIETEICIKAKMLGLKVVEIPSFEYPRSNGKSNLHTFRDGFRILRVLLSESLK